MEKIKLRRIIMATIGSSIFVISLLYIYYKFNWTEIFEIMIQANMLYLVGGGAVSISFFWFFRTIRLYVLLKNLNVRIHFIDLYLCNASSLALSIITPFQSGEMVKVELLRRYGIVGRFQGYGSFMVERILDLYIIILIAIISIILNLSLLSDIYVFLIFLFILTLALTGCFYVASKMNLKGRVGIFFNHIKQSVKDLKTLFYIIILTTISWIMVGIGWQASLYSVAIDLGFPRTMALMPVVGIISALSFIPGALGVAEVSTTEGLIQLNQSVAAAQSGAVILRGYSVITLFLGALHFLYWKYYRTRRNKIDESGAI